VEFKLANRDDLVTAIRLASKAIDSRSPAPTLILFPPLM